VNQFITELKFCPECGSLLRGKPCRCGYKPNLDVSNSNSPVRRIWNPPNPLTLYLKIYNVPYRELKYKLNSGVYIAVLEEINYKIDNMLINCTDCCNYLEDEFYCTLEEFYVSADSICNQFDPHFNY